MSKVQDDRKNYKEIYSIKKGKIELIDIPELQFVITRGEGVRDVYELHRGDHLWSITRLVNRLKDITKNEMDYKFKLMPLEAVWETNEKWEVMMQIPDIIDKNLFNRALQELEERKRSVRVPVEFIMMSQGQCVQTLHIGPYQHVEETIEKIKAYCENEGLSITVPRREIYINQPFCNPPEKCQTIIRVPVQQN